MSDLTGWEIMGLALWDYYFNKAVDAEISVQSNCAGFEKLPVGIFFRNADQLTDLEEYALSLCNGTVLDAGAGAGSHSLVLTARGFSVIPIDISESAVKVMKERGLTNASHGDVRQFKQNSVETILMLMNGIGLVGDLSGLKSFLNGAKKIVKPNGQILMDSSDLIYLRNSGKPDVENILKKGPDYGKVRYILEYKGLKSQPFDWLFVDQDTLKEFCLQTGWFCQVVYEEDYQYLARLTKL